ncbi:unnamed protein product [Medioppia subpectinata]|uniref:Ubiquitin thioesterase n=1 Tax=Medioppia subpectinata TaxID=1979941 RepID=A0A7R9KVV2_9ACAR|nr:unnamed protein product [Medioppia subpectinata]CAG2109453.1 unnamed protein product [Medioppia subpectinata]
MSEKTDPKDGNNVDKEETGDGAPAADGNRDELTMAQEKQIEKEIADNIDLIGQRLQVSQLLNEYSADDHIYRQKISDLQKSYSDLRKTRPDGNCFFRAFSFGYFEYLLTHREELDRFWPIAQQSKDKLVEQGFPNFTIEDFHDMFMDTLKKISDGMKSEQLVQLFNESGVSDYLVVYVRLITSGHLQKESDFFMNFIEGHRTVSEFCKQEVEPMYKESDHIHIIALTQEFKVGVRIVYMDRGEAEKANTHDFGIDEGSAEPPKVCLLYRPGHYDILYPIV